MPGFACQCDVNGGLDGHPNVDFEALENESGLPYVVTDGALRSLGCYKCHSARVIFQNNGSKEASNSYSGYVRKRKGSTNGSYDGSLESIPEDQDLVTNSLTILPHHLLERSLSYSSVEKNINCRLFQFGVNTADNTDKNCHMLSLPSSVDSGISDTSDLVVGSQSYSSDLQFPSMLNSSPNLSPVSPFKNLLQHIPLIGSMWVRDDQKVLDSTSGSLLIAAETNGLEFDKSQNASVEAVAEMNEALADKLSLEDKIVQTKPLDSRSLCLPLPFRFLKSTVSSLSSKDHNLIERLGADSVSSQQGKGCPPPRQSWLLRLFESKMFDMTIAITYLYNSKEPGVQTYIGMVRFIASCSFNAVCRCEICLYGYCNLKVRCL